MSLVEQVRTALQTAAGTDRLVVDAAPQRLSCQFAAIDSLACTFTQFTLSTDKLSGATPERLKKLSESLSARLTYLLEPISPIEFDSERSVVQLRSNPPQRDEDRTSYYELVVRAGGDLSLCRYAKTPGDPRHVVPASVTREVFLRLVSDFSAAVA